MWAAIIAVIIFLEAHDSVMTPMRAVSYSGSVWLLLSMHGTQILVWGETMHLRHAFCVFNPTPPLLTIAHSALPSSLTQHKSVFVWKHLPPPPLLPQSIPWVVSQCKAAASQLWDHWTWTTLRFPPMQPRPLQCRYVSVSVFTRDTTRGLWLTQPPQQWCCTRTGEECYSVT